MCHQLQQLLETGLAITAILVICYEHFLVLYHNFICKK